MYRISVRLCALLLFMFVRSVTDITHTLSYTPLRLPSTPQLRQSALVLALCERFLAGTLPEPAGSLVNWNLESEGRASSLESLDFRGTVK